MSDKARTNPTTDQETFETLYKQERDRLFANVNSMVRDRDRAEDITASAFGAAWEKRAQFRGESSLRTWLHAIGRNATRYTWRDEQRARLDPMSRLDSSRYAEPARFSSALEEEETRAQMWQALDRLPAKHRQILIEHYIEGRSLQEIA